MAKLMSKKTKEIVQTTAVLAVALLFIFFYIIYPIITVPDMTARLNRDQFEDPSHRPLNDPQAFINAGMTPDTFVVTTNDNIELAALMFAPDSSRTPIGTVILLHPDDSDRTYFLEYIPPLLDSGYEIIAYDQRASGHSAGAFFSPGVSEADDLAEIIAHLNLRRQLKPPVIVAGFGIGGDAALIASQNEKRIAGVIALNPHFTPTQWIEDRRKRDGALKIPFHKSVYFWWYQKFSGYPYERTGIDKILPVVVRTIIFADSEVANSREMTRLKEASPAELLEVRACPENAEKVRPAILEAINLLK
jgi:pimeloyl-ACP methyl ester carboxylesterase